MEPKDFFLKPGSIAQKQYEALRMYYLDGKNTKEVAVKFGYKHRGFTTILTHFNKKIKSGQADNLFFKPRERGRKISEKIIEAKVIVVELRKKYHSVEEIKTILDGKSLDISEKSIYNIIKNEGFSRLPRRLKMVKQGLKLPEKIKAEKSVRLKFLPHKFKSTSAGVLILLPYIIRYGIDKIIKRSAYPQTNTLNRLNSILSFVALKASNIRRYSSDERWCMDRGLGLFAGLNVLPKASWYTSYSHRVTSDMNLDFLKSMHEIWLENDLLSDTANLDFTTIPYWGEDEHLENNWAGKRGKALASMLAVLAHDPDTGIINYGNTNVMHKNESEQVMEFLDFYKSGVSTNKNLRYLVFDSKFTNYENLRKLDGNSVKFLTIRRRGKQIIKRLENIPANKKKKIRVEMAGNKKRSITIYDEKIYLKGYNKTIRQISITNHGKIKPAMIITNDFDLPVEKIVRKYTKRWIVEKAISEQVSFFHLNLVSSSMVIKVDFDFTMSILTHNLFRLLAMDLERYSHLADQTLFDKFILNAADVEITPDSIDVHLKKKRNLPLILEEMQKYYPNQYPWLNNLRLNFIGASYS